MLITANLQRRRRGRRTVVASVAALAVGGTACSMHPLPEDVSRANTFDIVEKIRCEAKAGLGGIPDGHKFLEETAIGYDFKFDITEENNADAGQLKLERQGFRPNSKLTLDFGASATRTRQNTRQFRIVESLAKLKKANCPDGPKRPNWIYPIAGRVGIDELVITYIRLERLTRLAKRDPELPNILPPPPPPPPPPHPPHPPALKAPATAPPPPKKIPVVFSDKLTFTTELRTGVTPTLQLATIKGEFRLTLAKMSTEAIRKDVHIVTVALARDGNGQEPPASLLRMAADGTVAISRQGARKVDAVVETNARAKDRVLYELERRRLLDEDEELTTKFLEALQPVP
jgi:hypothetical protein